jgi:phage gp46-like protein
MSDIATIFDPVKGIFDWAMDGPALLQDEGIATAVLLSLGCDKRANDTDTLPDDAIGPFGNGKKGSGDRRGWWGDFMTDAALDLQPGDHYPKPADRIGSWLWLFRRRKMTASLPGEIKAAATDALAWFVRDGIAKAVNLTAKAIDNQTILLIMGFWAASRSIETFYREFPPRCRMRGLSPPSIDLIVPRRAGNAPSWPMFAPPFPS